MIMKKYIKLYEEFVEENLTLTKTIEVTFRLLINDGVDPETIQNNFHDKFIQTDNPPFIYKEFTFEDFEIDFIGDIELAGSIHSEYAIKSIVKFEIEKPLDLKLIEHYIRDGMQEFLEEKRKEYVSDETTTISFMSFEIYDM